MQTLRVYSIQRRESAKLVCMGAASGCCYWGGGSCSGLACIGQSLVSTLDTVNIQRRPLGLSVGKALLYPGSGALGFLAWLCPCP